MKLLPATALALILALPAFAGPARPSLRGDITAKRDVITLGDLVADAPADLADRPLFRAPAIGATGTIQVRRIAEAVAALGLDAPESGGRVQVSVQRAARRIGAPEIEAAVKASLVRLRGLDPATVSVLFDGEAPSLSVPLELDGAVAASDVVYDPRLRRVTALVSVGDRQATLRVAGQVVETVQVAVLVRALARGETVAAGDVAVERRPRDGLPAESAADPSALVGQVAQRPLAAATPLRAGDLARPDLVARGEAVTIVYETPGVALSMRGQAKEGGPMGAVVSVLNPGSKKLIQATVIGPGRVMVGPPHGGQALGRVAEALPSR